MGANWNMVFVGTEEGKIQRNLAGRSVHRGGKDRSHAGKTVLIYDDEEGYMVYVPKERENAIGVLMGKWQRGRKKSD